MKTIGIKCGDFVNFRECGWGPVKHGEIFRISGGFFDLTVGIKCEGIDYFVSQLLVETPTKTDA